MKYFKTKQKAINMILNNLKLAKSYEVASDKEKFINDYDFYKMSLIDKAFLNSFLERVLNNDLYKEWLNVVKEYSNKFNLTLKKADGRCWEDVKLISDKISEYNQQIGGVR